MALRRTAPEDMGGPLRSDFMANQEKRGSAVERRKGAGFPMVTVSEGKPLTSRTSRQSALHFEVKLNELLAATNVLVEQEEPVPPEGPNSKRLACHVAVLREVLASGMLGGLQRVMEAIVGELLLCLYSNAVTSSPVGQAAGTYAGIEGVPFFLQLQQANEELELLKVRAIAEPGALPNAGPIVAWEPDIFERERDELLLEQSHARRQELEQQVEGLARQLRAVEEQHKALQREREVDVRALEAELRRWRQEAEEARAETRNLKKRAKEQEAVRLAFAELRQPALLAQSTSSDVGPHLLTMSRQLKEERELAEAVAMESQLLLLQNARINEYEAALAATPGSEQSALRETFVTELRSIQEELVKLSVHIRQFEEHLPGRPDMATTAAPEKGAAEMEAGSSGALRSGLAPMAAVEVSCDNGSSFQLLRSKGTPAATSALTLPPHATHVRLSTLEARPSGGTKSAGAGTSGQDGASSTITETLLPPSPDDPLWDGYFARVATGGAPAAVLAPTTVQKSALPRTQRTREVNLPALLQLIEAVFRAKLKAESGDTSPRKGEAVSLLAGQPRSGGHDIAGVPTTLHTFFYKWLEEKYILRPTVLLVAYGILRAIERFRSSHAVVRLFAQVLEGQSEDATWRYTMQWRRVLRHRTLEAPNDFADFALLMYPGMRDQEMESLLAGFISEHPQASKEAALEFLTGRLLDRTEPRLKKWSKILKWKDTNHRNYFRRQEFLDIASKLFPSLPLEDPGAAYDVAAKAHGPDHVPIGALALIVCCMDASLITTRGQQNEPAKLVPLTNPREQ